jgi:hypothetical protein
MAFCCSFNRQEFIFQIVENGIAESGSAIIGFIGIMMGLLYRDIFLNEMKS